MFDNCFCDILCLPVKLFVDVLYVGEWFKSLNLWLLASSEVGISQIILYRRRTRVLIRHLFGKAYYGEEI